jgi:hypothetical protein
LVAFSAGQDIYLAQPEAFGQLYLWYCRVLQAKRGTACIAYKMHMLVVVVAGAALALAQGIPHCIVCRWNRMNNTFIYKNLQRAVNSNAVKLLTAQFFYISMRQGIIAIEKKLKDAFSAVGKA